MAAPESIGTKGCDAPFAGPASPWLACLLARPLLDCPASPRQRLNKLRLRIPRKQNPGILRDLGHEAVHRRTPGQLGIDAGKVRPWQLPTQDTRGGAGIHQI